MTISMSIQRQNNAPRISRHIYGHFAEHLGRCVYEGLWVGEDSVIPNVRGFRSDVVAALRDLNIPNLRWPGGCFADEYHWMDGIGPRAGRPGSINSHWGGVVENNHVGTHEFMDLCEQLGTEPYIAGNLGSGTVREMQQWVEYLTGNDASAMPELRRSHGRSEPWKIPYWGVGNENWGCGGNMTAEQYACEFRRYATYCRNIHGNNLHRIACGPNTDDYHWTEVMMKEGRPGQLMNGLSLHYYTVPGGWGNQKTALAFTEADWFETMKLALRIDELISKHTAIMNKVDAAGLVGLMVDEWGTWFKVEEGSNPGFLYQQSSMRDALVAGLSLNVFNKHCRRVKMANIAQVVNVLQAPILTRGDAMIKTPTYHVFEMYKDHQDAALLDVGLESPTYRCGDASLPALNVSASQRPDGSATITFCNLDTGRAYEVAIDVAVLNPTRATARTLHGDSMHAHNTFDVPDCVRPREQAVQLKGHQVTAQLPPASVTTLKLH
jgi:alpha-N-arabinofuranosidase